MKDIQWCTRCNLHENRTQVIVGEGSMDANVLFVGECPGPDEDKAGRPFIGKAGKLLRRAIKNLGIDPQQTYITNIVKCFPFHSLNPKPENVEACSPWLQEQINTIGPKVIVGLGKFSSSYLLQIPFKDLRITKVSGRVVLRMISPNIRQLVLPVVHPSYVLRGGMSEANFLAHLSPMLQFHG